MTNTDHAGGKAPSVEGTSCVYGRPPRRLSYPDCSPQVKAIPQSRQIPTPAAPPRRKVVPPLEGKRLEFYRDKALAALRASGRPLTFGAVRFYAGMNALGSAGVDRVMGGLVAEGLVLRRELPGEGPGGRTSVVFSPAPRQVQADGGHR